MAFPIQRLRRLRQHEAFCRMVRETSLTPSDLIYPLFVVEGRDRREVIAKVMALPEADLKEPPPSGIQTKFENRVAWVKSYFIQAKVLESPLTCPCIYTSRNESHAPQAS
jgi:hypothetical protein